eukprot:5139520-Pleurochrysis_carterae.AAC.2
MNFREHEDLRRGFKVHGTCSPFRQQYRNLMVCRKQEISANARELRKELCPPVAGPLRCACACQAGPGDSQLRWPPPKHLRRVQRGDCGAMVV